MIKEENHTLEMFKSEDDDDDSGRYSKWENGNKDDNSNNEQVVLETSGSQTRQIAVALKSPECQIL